MLTKVKMKGLGYELGLFILVGFVLLFVWVFSYGAFHQISDSFMDISTNQTVDNSIQTVDSVIYWSFFLIFLFGIAWVIKSAIREKEQNYGYG